MSQYVKEVNAKEFDAIIQGEKPVVCDFWAPWCGPCRMLAPVLDQVAQKVGEKATFVKVNVDDEGELAMQMRISSIPCVKMFQNGAEIAQTVGFAGEAEMLDFVQSNLA